MRPITIRSHSTTPPIPGPQVFHSTPSIQFMRFPFHSGSFPALVLFTWQNLPRILIIQTQPLTLHRPISLPTLSTHISSHLESISYLYFSTHNTTPTFLTTTTCSVQLILQTKAHSRSFMRSQRGPIQHHRSNRDKRQL